VNGCGEVCARPSAYTKAGIQWLDRATIAVHVGRASAYALARDQARPADPARGSREDRGECTRSDGGGSSDGRSIRHRHSQRRRDRLSVQTPDPLGHRVNHLRPLILKTSQALSVGQEFVSDNAIGIMSLTPFRATEMLRSKPANCCPMPCPGIELAGLESFRQQSHEHLENGRAAEEIISERNGIRGILSTLRSPATFS
jgi:hypothetical protein